MRNKSPFGKEFSFIIKIQVYFQMFPLRALNRRCGLSELLRPWPPANFQAPLSFCFDLPPRWVMNLNKQQTVEGRVHLSAAFGFRGSNFEILWREYLHISKAPLKAELQRWLLRPLPNSKVLTDSASNQLQRLPGYNLGCNWIMKQSPNGICGENNKEPINPPPPKTRRKQPLYFFNSFWFIICTISHDRKISHLR